MSGLLQDLRYALRTLRRQPGFAAVAVLTLAIGIGANTAIFSVIDATLLRALPFREPERLMTVMLRMPANDNRVAQDMVWSYPKFRTLRDADTPFESVALHSAVSLTVRGDEGAERISAEMVGADYLRILGIGAARGRIFASDEDRLPPDRLTALVSHGLWQRRFGSQPDVVGRELVINGRPFTIVGVLPPGFAGLSGRAELWVPITAVRPAGTLNNSFAHQFSLIARLEPGVSPERAKAAMPAIGRMIDDAHPTTDARAAWGATAYTLSEVRLDPALRRSLVLLAMAVALVLLIACVNIANLLIARGAARQREVAVRLAIGAGRGRLVRQLLTESMVLAMLGAVTGVALAALAVQAIGKLTPVVSTVVDRDAAGLTTIGLSSIRLDAGALFFTFGIALLTALVFGLAPALHTSRASLSHALKSGGAPGAGFAGIRALTGRGTLVAAEVGLAVVLLVASGLMIKSLGRLFEARIGFDARNLLTVRVTLASARYSSDSAGAMWGQVLERMRVVPGVTDAAVGNCAPVVDNCDGTHIQIPGRGTSAHVANHMVTADYFRTLRVPVQRGRPFGPQDRRGSPRVVMINETAARMFWQDENPVGTFIDIGEPAEVVGVVGDVRFESLEQPAYPAVFQLFEQAPRSSAVVFVRTPSDPGLLTAAVRREVRDLDRDHAVYDVRPMSERLRDATSGTRFSTVVLGVFAAIALGLASIGIYGVMSLSVAQRTRELGIRLALGARHRDLLTMVLTQGMLLAGFGAALGIVGALASSRVMRAVLYEVTPLDASAYAAAAAVLAFVALLAVAVPARRAMRVNPLEALRHE
ncbi:MAG TPA: ABC transporter permease [Gemmatimonadaceae bacterium]|nr:ABC transporter permease [Gemmatimonadaceae bacterium]